MDLPQRKQFIGVKWLYKTKRIVEGNIERHKERLVVKGYKHRHGSDYAKTFVSVVRMETMDTMLSIVMQHKWIVYQMYIKLTFMNGVLKAKVYVAQPPRYGVESQEAKVYRLRKAFYGLKQAPHAWYNRIILT